MKGSILREIFVNLIVIGQGHWGRVITERASCHRSTVWFNSHTWQQSLSVILALKSLSRVYRMWWFILNWNIESFMFFVSLNGRTYNAAIVRSVRPASTRRTTYWCRFLERFRYIKCTCLPASGRWVLKWLNWLFRNYQVIFVITSKDFPPVSTVLVDHNFCQIAWLAWLNSSMRTKYDRTCQRSIEIISIKKNFCAP